jgi:phage-related protein
MSLTALTTFIEIKNRDGNVVSNMRYQNGKRDAFSPLTTNETTAQETDYSRSENNATNDYKRQNGNYISFEGHNYYYLPFIFSGASRTRTGDNLSASLILANNILAMNHAKQAVERQWFVRVAVCVVDPSSFAHKRTLTDESWLAASMAYDPETIEVVLSSAIDSVGSNAPNRTITTTMVGALPSSSNIQNL